MIVKKIVKDWGLEVLILSFFGLVIIPYGAGITFDSVSFFQAGDNFWSTGRYVHVAPDGGLEFAAHRFPLYPLILSLFKKIDPNLLTLQLLLFTALILAFRSFLKKSGSPKYFLLLLLTYPVFLNHFAIWTESLYAVLFVWLLIRVNKEQRSQKLVWVLVIIILLCLTRMVGMAAAGSLLVVYAMYKQPLRGLLVFTAGAAAIITWTMIGSFYLGETARIIHYHPITSGHLWHLVVELGSWLTPAGHEGIPFVTGCLLLMTPLLLAIKTWKNRREAGLLFWFLVIHFYAYLVFLTACKIFLDASIPFEARTLYPVLLNIVFLLALVQNSSLFKPTTRNRMRYLFPTVIVLAIGMNAPLIWSLRENGLGYNSKQWREFAFIGELQKLDATYIYTNDQAGIYLYAPQVQQPVLLPQKMDLYSKVKNDDYPMEMARMNDDLSETHTDGLIVWIRNGVTENVYPGYDELKQNAHYEVIYDHWLCLILRKIEMPGI
jgi:hypothetical protein